MDFSIVIPVRNRPGEIERCVRSCHAQRFPAGRYEVIVVDNGSTDMTARLAAGAGARVVSEPRPNRCLARNLGAKLARGRWIAFTDSDCEADPGWLESLARAAALAETDGTRTGALAGRIDPGPPSGPVEAYIAARRWIDQEKFLNESRRGLPPFAATANLAVRAEVFRETGGFDPALSIAGEDADWCWRAASAGWSLAYVPDAVVVHRHRATVRAMIRQAHDYGLGAADLFAKHGAARGERAWIEPGRWIWAAKGLAKTPWSLVMGPGNAERWFPWYDFLANAAQAAGRIRGGWRRRVWVG